MTRESLKEFHRRLRAKKEKIDAYWEARDQIRETDAAARRAKIKADRIGREIAAEDARRARDQAREARLRELRDEIRHLRSSALEEMANNPLARRWQQHLGEIDLFGPGAGGDLTTLLEAVESEKALWSGVVPAFPEWPQIFMLDDRLYDARRRDPKLPTEGKRPRALSAAELRFEQHDREREAARLREEERVARIASALASLLRKKQEYDRVDRQGT